MYILDATTKKLQAVLAGAITTSQPSFMACYVDVTTTTYTPIMTTGVLNSAVDVDVVAAPAASTQRQIKQLTFFNRDTVAVTLTVKIDISGTDTTVWQGTLQPSETLAYEDPSGWIVYSTTGRALSTAGDVVGPSSATDTAIAKFNGATGKLIQNSGITISAGNNIVMPASATVDGWDLSNSRIELSHAHGSTKSMLPPVAAAVTTSGTAYFVYLGQVTTGLTATLLWMSVNTGGTGAQTAEMGLFSTPAGAGGNQSLTKLVATATLGALTGTGNLGNSSSFATAIAAGTHLWAGVRTAMATTQPSVIGLTGDMQQGAILTTAASGVLTGAGPFAGVVPGFVGTLAWLAPDLRLQFT